MAVNETVGINLVADTKSLRSQLREATQELARLQDTAGASAEEIRKAAKRAGELKDRIGDARDTIDAFNPDAKFKAFGQTVVGVAGAFTAVQGALALVGVESEDVQKTLLKVQGALALSEGLNSVLGLKDAFNNLKIQVVGSSAATAANTATTTIASAVTKAFGFEVVATSNAFKVLKFAIAATGIGLLAIGLIAVVQNFDEIKKTLSRVIPGFETFSNSVGILIQKFTDFIGITNEANRNLDKLNKTSNKRKEALESELKFLEASGAGEKKLSEIRKKIINEDLDILRNKLKITGKLSEEEQKNFRELKTELLLIDVKSNKALLDEQKKEAEKRAKILEENADKEVAKEEEKVKRLLEIGKKGTPEYEQKLANLNIQFQDDIKLFADNEKTKYFITKKYEEDRFALFKENRKALTKEEEKEIDLKLEKLEKQGAKELAERNKTASIISKAMDKSLKKDAENEIKTANAIRIAKLNIASDALGVLSGFAEQGSGLQKGLALTQIAIDTGVAISGLTASTSAPSPDNLVTGGLAGFAKYTAGIIKILANIAQAKNIIQSAGPSSSSASIPVSNTIAPIVPQYQPAAPTSLDAKSLNTISNVVARAYVVESDITGSQKRISRIENAARI